MNSRLSPNIDKESGLLSHKASKFLATQLQLLSLTFQQWTSHNHTLQQLCSEYFNTRQELSLYASSEYYLPHLLITSTTTNPENSAIVDLHSTTMIRESSSAILDTFHLKSIYSLRQTQQKMQYVLCQFDLFLRALYHIQAELEAYHNILVNDNYNIVLGEQTEISFDNGTSSQFRINSGNPAAKPVKKVINKRKTTSPTEDSPTLNKQDGKAVDTKSENLQHDAIPLITANTVLLFAETAMKHANETYLTVNISQSGDYNVADQEQISPHIKSLTNFQYEFNLTHNPIEYESLNIMRYDDRVVYSIARALTKLIDLLTITINSYYNEYTSKKNIISRVISSNYNDHTFCPSEEETLLHSFEEDNHLDGCLSPPVVYQWNPNGVSLRSNLSEPCGENHIVNNMADNTVSVDVMKKFHQVLDIEPEISHTTKESMIQQWNNLISTLNINNIE